jgi:uncharacterized small protein (DUF1192 family)
MEKENTSLQTQSQQGGAVAPVSILSLDNLKQTMAAANELKQFVADQKLSSNIQGKQYVHVEGWQFAGAMLGLFAVSEGTECLNFQVEEGGKKKTIYRYKGYAAIYNREGRKVGGASGLCSGAEPNKKAYEEYAIESSAQTRATSKAFRVMLGWMMKAAGYETTPFEEMEGVNLGNSAQVMVSDELHARLATLMDEVGRLDLLPDAERKQLHNYLKIYRETAKDDMPERDAKKLEKTLLGWKEQFKELEF